jgi:hypothetical protein
MTIALTVFPADLGSLVFLQFFVTQTSAIWGIIALAKRFIKRPQPVDYGSGWVEAKSKRFMSPRAAVWSIVTLSVSCFVTIIGDWPLITGLIPWQQAVALQSTDFLNACLWVYEVIFSTLSSAFRTLVAAGSAVVALALNLRWFS